MKSNIYQIAGTITGYIWDGDKCTKEFSRIFPRDKSLHDAIKEITKDSAFKECWVSEATLTIIRHQGQRTYSRDFYYERKGKQHKSSYKI